MENPFPLRRRFGNAAREYACRRFQSCPIEYRKAAEVGTREIGRKTLSTNAIHVETSQRYLEKLKIPGASQTPDACDSPHAHAQ